MGTKKPHLSMRLFGSGYCSGSTLGELEAGAGTGTTGLFAFLHPRIAGEEALGLDQLAVLGVEKGERAGDRMADRDGLRVLATAFDDGFHVELVDHVQGLERRDDGVLEVDRREVILEGNAVDGHFPGSFADPDVGDRSLAAAGGAFGFGGRHDDDGKTLKTQRISWATGCWDS